MIQTLDQGVFTISLDFELAWGTRGRPSANRVGPYLDGTRRAIDRMLELFERYQISATWVMVGGLVLGGQERHPLLTAARYDDIPIGTSETHPHWYAEDILAKIRSVRPEQEIGCHTLTHMYVNESEASREQFDRELGEFVKLFERLGLPRPKSFIFPKHYMHHFDLLAKHGFTCYRGPESGWFERLPTPHLRGAFRLLNSKLRRTPVVGLPSRSPEGLVEIPSSQFYSPFQSVGKFLSIEDRVQQAIAGLNAAAAQKKVYHLWTHPFNMGDRTDELMDGLERILKHFATIRSSEPILNKSMQTLTKTLVSNAESKSN
ncbi:MAG: polysaccharide deacetylase family protein [Planctomycetota bacterium]